MFPTAFSYLKTLLVFTLFITTIGESTAQTPLAAERSSTESLMDEGAFLFPSQVDARKYYIDLEMLNGQPDDIRVLDEKEQVVMDVSLSDTPGNALYELDLSSVEKGKYVVRVRSFREERQKDVVIE